MAETDPSPLAACPFCGGEAIVREYRQEAQWVACQDCHARTDRYGPTPASRAAVIAAWNRRPQPTAAHGLADEIERAVMVCPQCQGEGGYPDGLDEAACHTECTRCGSNGWIVDLTALRSSQPDTREGFAAGIEAEARRIAKQVMSVRHAQRDNGREYSAALEGARLALEAHRAAKETTDG